MLFSSFAGKDAVGLNSKPAVPQTPSAFSTHRNHGKGFSGSWWQWPPAWAAGHGAERAETHFPLLSLLQALLS